MLSIDCVLTHVFFFIYYLDFFKLEIAIPQHSAEIIPASAIISAGDILNRFMKVYMENTSEKSFS